MKCNNSILVAILFAISPTTFAQEPTAMALVKSGVSAYIKGNATAAIQAWVKGSALEGNTQAMSQANMLRQVEDFYGKPESFDVIAEHPLSPRAQLVYFSINYAKGILYCRFNAYEQKPGKWIVTEFKFHTEAPNILPSSLAEPR